MLSTESEMYFTISVTHIVSDVSLNLKVSKKVSHKRSLENA